MQANTAPIISNRTCMAAGKGGRDGWNTQPM
jgi:hypothetical protein